MIHAQLVLIVTDLRQGLEALALAELWCLAVALIVLAYTAWSHT